MTYPYTPSDLSAGDEIEYWDPAQPTNGSPGASIETGEILWIDEGANPYCVSVDVDGWARQMIRASDTRRIIKKSATQEEMF